MSQSHAAYFRETGYNSIMAAWKSKTHDSHEVKARKTGVDSPRMCQPYTNKNNTSGEAAVKLLALQHDMMMMSLHLHSVVHLCGSSIRCCLVCSSSFFRHWYLALTSLILCWRCSSRRSLALTYTTSWDADREQTYEFMFLVECAEKHVTQPL